MKIVSSTQMRELEDKAYALGFKDETFMDEAGKNVAFAAMDYAKEHALNKSCYILIGKGNNGGDGLVSAVHLLNHGFNVSVLLASASEKHSPLCQKNLEKFLKCGGLVDYFGPSFSKWPKDGFILDGLFGTGLKEAPKGAYAELIEKANQLHLPILAIDIPSGLNGDTGEAKGAVIHAAATIYLGMPKIGFFINQGFEYVGELISADFGLPESLLREVKTTFTLIEKKAVIENLPKIKRTRHKYEAGSVSILAGSKTMPGAGLLASASALRSGSGMVHLFYPEGMENLLTSSPFELIKIPYDKSDLKTALALNKADAIAIGPGIGQDEETSHFFEKLIPLIEKPLVIDADGLNILAKSEIKLAENTLLTPHLGEMRRLLHLDEKPIVNLEFLKRCQNFAKEKKIILILKGAPSFIFSGDQIFVSPFGDPGMATAGSGDVLTGLLASFIAQKLTPEQAAWVGVAFHGLAGKKASEALSAYAMIASDIYRHYGEIFKERLANFW